MTDFDSPKDSFHSWAVMRDVYDVGTGDKLIGYVTEETIRASGIPKKEHIQKFERAGLRCIEPTSKKPNNNNAALFVYHPEKLWKKLRENASILTQYSWPISAQKFCEKVITEDAPERTELFDLVADCFNDAYNPLRKVRAISPEGHMQDVPQKHDGWFPQTYTRADIPQYADAPLISTCEHLHDLGIHVARATANAKTVQRNEPAALWIEYSTLSEPNRMYANSHMEIRKRGEKQYACLEVPMNHRTRLAEVQSTFQWILSGFHVQ